MRKTDIDIRRRIADLMRLAVVLMLSAWTMLAVVSCGSGGSDEPGTPTPGTSTPTPIVFSAQQPEDTQITRAATPLQDLDIKTFKVWANKSMKYANGTYSGEQTVISDCTVNYIENSAGTSTTNTHGWEYVNQQPEGSTEQSIKYWDWSAKAYRFFGVTQAKVQDAIAWTENSPSFSATVDATTQAGIDAAPYFSHLWFSNGNTTQNQKPFGKVVQLEFLKPFARVRFIFVTGNPEMSVADLYLTNAKFRPASASDGQKTIAVKGTFTVTYPASGSAEEWSVSATNDDKIEALTHDYYETPNDAGARYWYTLLPAKNQGPYKLSLSVSGEDKPCYVPAEFMEWLPGFSYTYIFKVSEEGGVEFGGVYTAYTDWMTGKEVDYSIYNW